MPVSTLITLLMVLGFAAAVGVGVWMGLQRSRQLREIAREALTSPTPEKLESLRLKATRQPTTVRPFFRVLGFVVGPVMLLGGLIVLAFSVRSWAEGKEFILLGLGSVAVGILITRAAITGRDPYLR
jgi:hypothetical protein